jgi:molybdopterin-containing oxidoreductase family membrane subunit
MYQGHDGHGVLVPWMTASTVLSILGLLLLLFPQVRRREGMLALACVMVVVALWIEKGLGLVITGFVPSPLGYYNEYWPSTQEVLIGLGVYGIGAFVLTILYKIAVGVREELK